MKRLVLSVVLGASFGSTFGQIQGYSVGQTVADFTVTDINGNSHTLYNYTAAGQYVMLDFFFVTCPPCQQTTPIFNELHDKYGCNAGDLVCLSINTGQDNNAQVAAFETTYGGSFSHSPAVSGDGGSAAVDGVFNPAAYPTYCLIGPDNKLVNADIWPINSVADFESAFPMGSNITPMACTVGLTPEPGAENIPMNIYPNPASGVVHIDLGTDNIAQVSIEITDLTGRTVLVQPASNITSRVMQMNVGTLQEGTYMVLAKNNNNTVVSTKRITIAR